MQGKETFKNVNNFVYITNKICIFICNHVFNIYNTFVYTYTHSKYNS